MRKAGVQSADIQHDRGESLVTICQPIKAMGLSRAGNAASRHLTILNDLSPQVKTARDTWFNVG